jgi:hypothetical protein
MNAIADPYPPDLAELDELPAEATVVTAEDRQVRALNRIALALEQLTVLLADRLQPVQNAPGAALTALPPVQTAATADVCPIHGTPWKLVPAGVSKRTGAAYQAFRACSTQGCDQRPKL